MYADDILLIAPSVSVLYTTLFTVQGTAATKQLKRRKTTIDSTIRRTHLSDSLTTFPKLTGVTVPLSP